MLARGTVDEECVGVGVPELVAERCIGVGLARITGVVVISGDEDVLAGWGKGGDLTRFGVTGAEVLPLLVNPGPGENDRVESFDVTEVEEGVVLSEGREDDGVDIDEGSTLARILGCAVGVELRVVVTLQISVCSSAINRTDSPPFSLRDLSLSVVLQAHERWFVFSIDNSHDVGIFQRHPSVFAVRLSTWMRRV